MENAGTENAAGFRADGCKVFAGVAQARPATFESLGREISSWLAANPAVRIVHLDTQLRPSAGRLWLMIVVFFVGHESNPEAAGGLVEEAPDALAGQSFEPSSADEAERMRRAAEELFGAAPGTGARRAIDGEATFVDDDDDDGEGPLDLPPPSDEPMDIRPL